MKEPQTRLDLDIAFSHGCSDPGCKHPHPEDGLVMSPACHRGAPVFAMYDIKKGTMSLQCAVCESNVTVVQVAKTLEDV